MAFRLFNIRLKNVDFPTLGRPTIAMSGLCAILLYQTVQDKFTEKIKSTKEGYHKIDHIYWALFLLISRESKKTIRCNDFEILSNIRLNALVPE